MKLLIHFALLIFLSLQTLGQGTVLFYNHVTQAGIDAPVFDADRVTRLAGSAFLAQLYAGPSSASLTPVGQPRVFQTGLGAGYWSPDTVVIPNVAAGTSAFLQVHVWSASLGTSFEAAAQAGAGFGLSKIFSVLTGNDTKGNTQPPSFPANLAGLESFSLVPEPGPGVLFCLGSVCLFALGKRRLLKYFL